MCVHPTVEVPPDRTKRILNFLQVYQQALAILYRRRKCVFSSPRNKQVAIGMFGLIAVLGVSGYTLRRRRTMNMRGEFRGVRHQGLNDIDNL